MEWITVSAAFEQKLFDGFSFENMIIRDIATKRVITYSELIMLGTDKVIYCPENKNEHIILKPTEVEFLKED